MDSVFVTNGTVKLDALDNKDGQADDESADNLIVGVTIGNWDAQVIIGSPGSAAGADDAEAPELPRARANALLPLRSGDSDSGSQRQPYGVAIDALSGAPAAFGGSGSTLLSGAATPIFGFDGMAADDAAFAVPEASTATLTVIAAAAPAGTSGSFVQLGPSPSSGPTSTVQSGDNPPNGTVAGAVQAIATDPSDANTIYLGAPNGGVWVTHDGGASWTPLTDKQASLSVASLGLDPTDATHQTLIAGIGLTSNGTVGSFSTNDSFFAGTGGQRTGILYSRNGGTTWSALGGAALSGQSVVGVAARGSILLAATFEPASFFTGDSAAQGTGGLFRSTDGGTTFTQVMPASGLAAGPVTSLVGDPASSTKLYAAITSQSDHAATAVFVSSDTGATWTQIFGAAQSGGVISAAANQTIARVAASGSSIAIGVVDTGTGRLAGLFLSQNSGASWTSLTVPNLNPGGQGVINFAIALDPTVAGIVYVTGDRLANSPFTVQAWRVTASGATSITDAGTSNGSTVHADSRAIAFDASGRLILGTDGGIYARTSPQDSSGAWQGLNGSNLSLFQPYAVAFDGNSKRLAIAAQDTGVAFESARGSQAFTAIEGADGITGVINDVTAGDKSAIYSAFQNLGDLTRRIVDSQGNPFGPTPTLRVNFNISISPTFTSPFILNKVDPSRIAIGTDHVYLTQDTLSNINTFQTSVNLTLTDLGTVLGGIVTTIAYGTQDNNQAVLAGVDGSSDLWLSTAQNPGLGTLLPLAAYTGLAPTAVRFDLRSMARLYAADGSKLFGSLDQGVTIRDLTSNLAAADVIRPTALEFISNNGVNALLVGGLDNVANAQSPLAVADSDGSGNLTGWRAFGTGLPNTIVSSLTYDPKADTLATGMFGRGGWALYDVTSNFASATVLQFGLADNDSNPDVSLLAGSRPLVKFGIGTLTITGTATYTGGTTINGGSLQIGNGSTSGGIGGNVVDNGAFKFNQPNGASFSGAISGSGNVLQLGSGKLTLNGTSSYSGITAIGSGSTLELATSASAGTGAIGFLGASGALDIVSDSGFDRIVSALNVGTSGAKTNFIDIEGHPVTATGSGTTNSGTITLSDGATLNLTNLILNGVTTWFANTVDDGAGGSDVFVSDSPPCFCRGTMILTERGEIAVEELAVGDRVKTLAGGFKPIVWIGFGRDLVTRKNRLARPVIVRRGALADNVPQRDLYLTHGHALYFAPSLTLPRERGREGWGRDGALIPVENLVNYRSILWDETARVVEYYHIELEDHDVLFAEGAPAESYYDAGNRALFHNTRSGSAAGAAKPAFPVLNGGDVVDRVWAALFARAGGAIERDTTDDPDLHLLVAGRRLDPAAVAGGAYVFELAGPPPGALKLCSRSGVPSLLGITRHDHRKLGVAISRIVLRQPGVATAVEHDAPLFVEGGGHAPESGYCWTDGSLDLPEWLFAHLEGAFTLSVHTERPGMRYPVAAALAAAA